MATAGVPAAQADRSGLNDPQLQRSVEQAFDEGHDADIPSDIGYVLDEAGEQKRRQSFAERRRNSLARKRSHADDEKGHHHHDLEKGTEAGADELKAKDDDEGGTTSEDETNIVWWDGPDDPQNPYNWPTWRKVMNCALISALTFVTPLASSIFAPGVPQLMREFQSGNVELAAFVVSVYVLGFAAGPMLIAPLSEIYGRLPVYHICNIAFVGFLVGCALAPSLNALIVFRFLSGIFGSCPLTNGGGTIADMIAQERRGAAMAVFSVGPLLGPIIGPVAGGFLAEAEGWRWVFWLLVILSGVLSVVLLIFARETYAPVLLQRKVDRLRKETGNDLLRSKLDAGLSTSDYFKRGIVRPFKMLLFSPLCSIFAVYVGITYGYLYLLFTSITIVFEQSYGFGSGIVGLVFLGLGAAKEGQGMKPEYRLRPLPIGAILLPAGFFIYGWTAQYHVHWIVPIIGHVVIGVGNLLIFMAINMALVDTFTIYAASALASNTVVRSVFGAVLPLCGLKMYDKLGLGWGNSLLGFIAVAMIPVSFLLLKYGEALRKKFPLERL
ncbi:bicyclomycin resistance protein [Coniochaeta ligniaria NRRL 30616]|uniref:Bicyclomycin resistance protein n=1 Tax=Coniochaeta ligniaria NRRL 30616 TaxID=1408157 RepID=A0A1J7ILJ2_9PEZI|nr:bicyclomycin resistance protein [Coniochaeta ligniaria NRRL 30616]